MADSKNIFSVTKVLFEFLLTVVLVMCILGLSCMAQKATSLEVIYIKPDGSVEPIGTSILVKDNMTYTFTNNIEGSLVIQRDNIMIDGNGYNLTGTADFFTYGLTLIGRNNVTIKNIAISLFDLGLNITGSSRITIVRNNISQNLHECIRFGMSSNDSTVAGNNIEDTSVGIIVTNSNNNSIVGNCITGCWQGVTIDSSSYNTISGNNITGNSVGIWFQLSSNNTISQNIIAGSFKGVEFMVFSDSDNLIGNVITNNSQNGIYLESATNVTISQNEISDNENGVFLSHSSQNFIYLNDFVNNTSQAYYYVYPNSPSSEINFWNDSSKGNYWSDYLAIYPNATETSSGTWNTPYVMDANNTDYYPQANPYVIPEFPAFIVFPSFVTVTLIIVTLYKKKLRYVKGSNQAEM